MQLFSIYDVNLNTMGMPCSPDMDHSHIKVPNITMSHPRQYPFLIFIFDQASMFFHISIKLKVVFTQSLPLLQIRYAEHLPSVLKNITCTFPGRKKVGVVGRTGSGKSTLIQAIFRIVEPKAGSIIIDDVDISRIGLHDLRSRLSIIPQDPTMFDGTVRGNLDPLEKYSEFEIWEVVYFALPINYKKSLRVMLVPLWI